MFFIVSSCDRRKSQSLTIRGQTPNPGPLGRAMVPSERRHGTDPTPRMQGDDRVSHPCHMPGLQDRSRYFDLGTVLMYTTERRRHRHCPAHRYDYFPSLLASAPTRLCGVPVVSTICDPTAPEHHVCGVLTARRIPATSSRAVLPSM